jgi:anti-sigma factor ChrR (cupin superfamily)
MNIMGRVTIDTDGNVRIALSQQFPVHAGFVLAKLIGAHGGVKPTHVGGVGMAFAAERGDLRPLDVSPEPGGFAHGYGHVVARRVAAVAARAQQALLRVDAAGKFIRVDAERRVELPVTLDATILSLRSQIRSHEQDETTRQEKRA